MENDIPDDKKEVNEEISIYGENTFKKIKFEEEDRKIIIKNAQKIRKIIDDDKGQYIISCFETVPSSNFTSQHFDNLVQLLRYEYSHGIVNLLMASLINPPFLVMEINKIVKDIKVKKFLDEISIKYGTRITSLYKYHLGELDWQYIKSIPIIRDDAIALSSKIILANGETITFTSPLNSLSTISLHFLRHINTISNFMKERAFSEIHITELEKVGKELEKILKRLNEYEKTKETPAEENEKQEE